MTAWARIIGRPPTQSVADLVTVDLDGVVSIHAVGHSPDDWPDVDPTRSTSPPYRGAPNLSWAR